MVLHKVKGQAKVLDKEIHNSNDNILFLIILKSIFFICYTNIQHLTLAIWVKQIALYKRLTETLLYIVHMLSLKNNLHYLYYAICFSSC